ncbi:MAG: SDR family NAD(P)-dependent oxidoreductase [Gammaproteobacteria bacterium]
MTHHGADTPTVLVTGAANGIGFGLVQALLARRADTRVFASTRRLERADALRELARSDARVQCVECDITDADELHGALAPLAAAGSLDQVINTVGVLHDDQGMRPERRLADVDPQSLMRAFTTNAMAALMLAQVVEPWMRKSARPMFASLSARVGSIGDNRLGGWYSYRASKAALNMMLKTLSIEWARGAHPITCVAVHPGTVRTGLSAPFVKGSRNARVFSPAQSADHLLNVLDAVGPAETGNFYAWDGEAIPW